MEQKLSRIIMAMLILSTVFVSPITAASNAGGSGISANEAARAVVEQGVSNTTAGLTTNMEVLDPTLDPSSQAPAAASNHTLFIDIGAIQIMLGDTFTLFTNTTHAALAFFTVPLSDPEFNVTESILHAGNVVKKMLGDSQGHLLNVSFVNWTSLQQSFAQFSPVDMYAAFPNKTAIKSAFSREYSRVMNGTQTALFNVSLPQLVAKFWTDHIDVLDTATAKQALELRLGQAMNVTKVAFMTCGDAVSDTVSILNTTFVASRDAVKTAADTHLPYMIDYTRSMLYTVHEQMLPVWRTGIDRVSSTTQSLIATLDREIRPAAERYLQQTWDCVAELAAVTVQHCHSLVAAVKSDMSYYPNELRLVMLFSTLIVIVLTFLCRAWNRG